MAVFLVILQVIGKVLLTVLIILAVLVLLLLFWPFCYSGKYTKNDSGIHADGRIWWLCHAVHASGYFNRVDGKNTKNGEIRIFGLPLIRMIRNRRNSEHKKNQPAAENDRGSEMPAGRKADGSARKKPTAAPGRWKYMPDASSEKQGMRPGVYHRREPSMAEKISARIASFFGRVKKKFAQLAEKLKNIGDWLLYLDSDSFGRLKNLLIRQVGGILRHILPHRVRGYVEFGTGDPASTGKALGVIALVYPVLPKELDIIPDFDERKLEADTDVSGHFFLIVVLTRALKILLNRDFRALRKRLKNSKSRNTSSDKASEDRTTDGNSNLHHRKKDTGKAA